MDHENDLQRLPVADLAQRCAEETKNYFQQQRHETGYCFELFRRAVVIRDNEAWDAVYAQYSPQVERWVYRHPDFALANEEAQDFTIQAFERFSRYFTEEKFSNSKSLAGVLSYLQLCVHGAIVDCLRKVHYEQIELDETIEKRTGLKPIFTPEELLQGQELWQLIQKRLKNKKEYIVVYASIILGLTPLQILAEYLDVFQNAAEISQCKANVFARLARDPEIRKFARWDD